MISPDLMPTGEALPSGILLINESLLSGEFWRLFKLLVLCFRCVLCDTWPRHFLEGITKNTTDHSEHKEEDEKNCTESKKATPFCSKYAV
jgi:hypothetical protein